MDKILVISCETTGFGNNYNITKTNAGHYQPIAWGMAVIDNNYNVIDKIYVEIKWDTRALWDKGAERVHKLTIEHLQENGLYELQAVEEIGSFIFEHFHVEPIPIMGYNTHFAVAFLNEMFTKHGVQLKFNRKVYDLNTIGHTLVNCTKRNDIFEIFGIKQKSRNALSTTLNIIKCFKTIRTLWNTLS